MKKCNLEESKIIESYKQCYSARIVAEQFDVSDQTIYRILEKNGVERRRPKTERKKRLTKARKYCPGLVGMLYSVLGLNEKSISICAGIDVSSVYAILNRKFERTATVRKKRVSKKDIDIDALEADYLAGASTYELSEKYGVYHSTISKWMIQRGHKRGKFCACEKTHICEICGNTFVSRVHNAKYCSKKCENKAAWRNRPSGHIRRARKYGAVIDNSVTLKKVYERDGGICQLCGGKCDYSDINDGVVGKTYPSIDHIVSLKNGGSHTWDNVQLAHHFCNSVKREHELDEIHDKVIFYAKEQAITYKCA